MRDFTSNVFRRLIESCRAGGYTIVTYREFITKNMHDNRVMVLRHDVDGRAANALDMALLENQLEVCSTYYFRDMPGTFKPEIISAISKLGHEVGYHYENMSKCDGDGTMAFADFKYSLEKFRKIVPVHTISSHGRPLSVFDNISLWKKYDYKQVGIVADVNLDTDFTNILYLTDTGGQWNSKFNRRDKVQSNLKCNVRTTEELVGLINRKLLPDKVILNIHPQRWTDDKLMWYREKLSQSLKNAIKYFFFMRHGNGTYQ